MELSKRSLAIFSLGWLTSLILVGCIAGYYYMKYQNLLQTLKEYESCVIHVNICIDYKEWNGTIVWYNNTIVPIGCDLLSATKKIAVVNCTYWPSYQSYFVDAINNVWKNDHEGKYWMWYQWTGEGWRYGQDAADDYILSPNETVMWRYEKPHYSPQG
jgi:hypothetical protein